MTYKPGNINKMVFFQIKLTGNLNSLINQAISITTSPVYSHGSRISRFIISTIRAYDLAQFFFITLYIKNIIYYLKSKTNFPAI